MAFLTEHHHHQQGLQLPWGIPSNSNTWGKSCIPSSQRTMPSDPSKTKLTIKQGKALLIHLNKKWINSPIAAHSLQKHLTNLYKIVIFQRNHLSPRAAESNQIVPAHPEPGLCYEQTLIKTFFQFLPFFLWFNTLGKFKKLSEENLLHKGLSLEYWRSAAEWNSIFLYVTVV